MVARITTSRSRTASAAVDTARAGTPSSARTRAANDSRLDGVRLKTVTARSGRTAAVAQTCVHACAPAPTTPSVVASGRASASTAAPPSAPVRREPTSSPTAIARIRPVRASCRTTSCSPDGSPNVSYDRKPYHSSARCPAVMTSRPPSSVADARGGAIRVPAWAARNASRIAATAMGASSRAATSVSVRRRTTSPSWYLNAD